MGTFVIVIILALIVWNALRTLSRQKKRMKEWKCTGDCASCKTPCQAKRLYGREK